MTRALPAIAILAVASVLWGCGQPGDGEFSARVERVVDGDTIIVDGPAGRERVRYIGIDTPETVAPDRPVGCYGPQASAANHRLVEGRTVRVVPGAESRDRYDRLLAYVYLPGSARSVNEELVRIGAADTLTIAPNTEKAGELAALRRQARARGAGLWGTCR